MRSRLLLGFCVAALAVCAGNGTAYASFGFSALDFNIDEAPPAGAEPKAPPPADTLAGTHPYEVIASFHLNASTKNEEGDAIPDGEVKDLEVELPPGLIGNARALPQCPMNLYAKSSLGSSSCPASTQVGIIKLEASITSGPVAAAVYNLEPPAGVPARFGAFVLFSPIYMDVALRTGGDYGLTVDLHDTPQFVSLLGGSLDLWGVPADPGHDGLRGSCMDFHGESSGNTCPSSAPPTPFLTLPTSCEQLPQLALAADSWQEPLAPPVLRQTASEDALGNPVGLDGCEQLDFSPRIEVASDTTAADSPMGLTIDLRMPPNEAPAGRAEAALKDLSMTLPLGVSINPAAGAGLAACPAQAIALGSASEPTCPDNSKVGAVEIESPLLSEPLQGSIYLAQPNQNPFASQFAVYLVAEADGMLVKLAARLDADPSSGQLRLTLSNAPQLPFTDMKLSFDGGPHAVLASPRSCGRAEATAELTSYAEPQPVAARSGFAVNGCMGRFAPSLVAGATSSRAGRGTGFALRLARADGEQPIGSVVAVLPAGLLANLGSVPLCGETAASTGGCETASQVGTATIGAGAGPDPDYITGPVYLTGPYGGAPFGLLIAIPAVAGPFDLGAALVRARVYVDPTDTHLTIETDPLPTVIGGVPLRIKTLDLSVRSGFMFDPTNCEARQVTATMQSAEGASASAATPFAVAGCAALSFSPRFSASTQEMISRRGGAALTVKVNYPPGPQANLRTVSIGFPKQFSPRLSAIQGACPQSTFTRNPASCPATSAVGTATIATRVFAVPLQGPVYLVSRARRSLPELALVLQGQGVDLRLFGAFVISHSGKVTAVLSKVPDAPIASLVLQLPRGPRAVLGVNTLAKATGTLCGRKLVMSVLATAQNGVRIERSVRLTAGGCSR
jgi:hypothetical protein